MQTFRQSSSHMRTTFSIYCPSFLKQFFLKTILSVYLGNEQTTGIGWNFNTVITSCTYASRDRKYTSATFSARRHDGTFFTSSCCSVSNRLFRPLLISLTLLLGECGFTAIAALLVIKRFKLGLWLDRSQVNVLIVALERAKKFQCSG